MSTTFQLKIVLHKIDDDLRVVAGRNVLVLFNTSTVLKVNPNEIQEHLQTAHMRNISYRDEFGSGDQRDSTFKTFFLENFS